MIDFLINSILCKNTKCWKCKYFLTHKKINQLGLDLKISNIHIGVCNKIKNSYKQCSYNSKICKDYKKI